MSTSLPPLVPEQSLRRWLQERWGSEADLTVVRHQAGHSNETFFVTWGGRSFVLRRPPLGAFLPSAHDVGREYRVLSGLASTPVRVPKPELMCEDESVIGAPFYLMEKVTGDVIRDYLPDAYTVEHRPAVGDELVDALVELHRVDPGSCGLGGFGKPCGYLDRQLRRWGGQLELTLPFTRPLPQLQEVGAWLRDHLPESQATCLVHGDYKLDNVIFSPPSSTGDPARLAAILDWEMSTLGDPLADVGWMTSFWREPGESSDDLFAEQAAVTELPGFPSRAELVDRYSEATGYDTSGLGRYQVPAVWKLAIRPEGSSARHLAGMTDDPFFARMKEGVPALARKAMEVANS